MPTYHLPDGRVIHSDTEISPSDLDSLIGGQKDAGIFKGGLLDPNVSLWDKAKQVLTGPDDPNLVRLSVGQDIPGMKQAGEWAQKKLTESGHPYLGKAANIAAGLTGIYPFPAKAPIKGFEPTAEIGPKLLTGSEKLPIYAPESTLLEPSKAESGYTATGKPAELLHPNVRNPASEIIDATGDAPPLHENIPQKPSEEHLPPPGTARSRDISAAAANWGSADQVLEARTPTKPIVNLVRDKGWDKTQREIGTNIRILGDITKGMNSNQLEAFGKAAEGLIDPKEVGIPDVEERLKSYRALMDNIFDKADVARGGKVGYIDDYVTHIEKAPEDFQSAYKSIFGFRQGKEAARALFERPEISGEPTGEAAGIYGKGTGSVGDSPFVKHRSDAIDNLDYNVNRIGRMYIESMARDTYLRPAIEQATELVKNLPDSKLKELSEWYIKNITRFDASPQLNDAYKKAVRFILDTTSRSMLGLNPHLQALHAMRLGPVYSELGAKYSLDGLGNMLKNPSAAYREVAELGLMPNELMPFKFQTTGEKIDSILNFKSMIDFVDRSIAYNGFKQKYLDMNMAPQDAIEKAISDTKKATFVTDPSRASRALNPSYDTMGGIGKLTTQYKQVPAKIAEWIVRTAAHYKDNPAAAARASALLGTSAVLNKATGGSIFHMPVSLGDWSAASLNELRKITSHVVKGDIPGAMQETALWLTPAGLSAKRWFSQ